MYDPFHPVEIIREFCVETRNSKLKHIEAA